MPVLLVVGAHGLVASQPWGVSLSRSWLPQVLVLGNKFLNRLLLQNSETQLTISLNLKAWNYLSGLSLLFESDVTLNYTPVTKLLLYE